MWLLLPILKQGRWKECGNGTNTYFYAFFKICIRGLGEKIGQIQMKEWLLFPPLVFHNINLHDTNSACPNPKTADFLPLFSTIFLLVSLFRGS